MPEPDNPPGRQRSAGSGESAATPPTAGYCGDMPTSMIRLGCLSQVQEPILGNPLPIRYAGKLISQDLALSSLELNQMASSIPIRTNPEGARNRRRIRPARIPVQLDVPDVEYSILDIPPALAISQHYLTSIFGPAAISAMTTRRARTPGRASASCCRIGWRNSPTDTSTWSSMSAHLTKCPRRTSMVTWTPSIGSGRVGHTFKVTRKAASRVSATASTSFRIGKNWRQIYSGAHRSCRVVEKIFQLGNGR